MSNTILILEALPALSTLVKNIIETKTSLTAHVATSIDNLLLFNQTQRPTICVLALNYKNATSDGLGLEYLRQMRQINPDLYCIFTASFFVGRTQSECYEMVSIQNASFVGKPYDFPQFLNAIDNGLEHVKSIKRSA